MAKKRKFNDPFGIHYLTDLTGPERILLYVMATYAFSETGELYPANAKLAYDCDMDPSRIRKLKKSLKSKNIIIDTGKTVSQVPVLKLNLDEDKFIIGTDKSTFKRIKGGGPTVPPGEDPQSSRGRTHSPGGEDPQSSKHISKHIKEHISLTGGAKTSPLLGDKKMDEEQLEEKPKSLKDLNPKDLLEKKKYKTPKGKWNLTHLITLWDSTYTLNTGDSVVLHSPAHRAAFRRGMEHCDVPMDEIAEAIEATIENWNKFYIYCNTRSVSFIPHGPDFRFFSRCMSQAIDFTRDMKKPKSNEVTITY